MKENSNASLPFQAIFFDLDGTLIDTESTATKVVLECFTEWKLSFNPKDAEHVTGRTWESALTYLFEKYTPPIPVAEAKKKILKAYRQAVENDLVIVPGGAQAVQSLAQVYPLALVSGSGRSEILWALDQLQIRHHFKVILGAEDYPRSKPHPDGYLKAADLLNVDPNRCLVFEDSTAGILSALTAGSKVIAITSTNHFDQDVARAHFKITDLRSVNLEWVNKLKL